MNILNLFSQSSVGTVWNHTCNSSAPEQTAFSNCLAVMENSIFVIGTDRGSNGPRECLHAFRLFMFRLKSNLQKAQMSIDFLALKISCCPPPPQRAPNEENLGKSEEIR